MTISEIERPLANECARQLRNNAPDAERKFRHGLRNLKASGRKFRRQAPIDHFIVDFVCLSHRLVIEVDGATHSIDDEIARNMSRQRYIESQGFMVLRFTNMDVVTNIVGAMDTIVGALDRRPCKITPTPDPSPQGGGELLPVELK